MVYPKGAHCMITLLLPYYFSKCICFITKGAFMIYFFPFISFDTSISKYLNWFKNYIKKL